MSLAARTAAGLLLAVVLTTAPALSQSSEADAVGRRFFAAIRARDYAAAYATLSTGVRRDLPYAAFAQRSRDILAFQVVSLDVVERGRNLVRYQVRGRLRIVHRGEMFDAVYAGTVGVSRNQGAWRIAAVDLSPVTQKRLGKAPPDYHL